MQPSQPKGLGFNSQWSQASINELFFVYYVKAVLLHKALYKSLSHPQPSVNSIPAVGVETEVTTDDV